MTFGSKLKRLRTDVGMTQEQLAKALNISKTSLVRYELDKREPSFEAIKKIKNYFNISIDEIMNDLQETTYIEDGKKNFKDILQFTNEKEVIKKIKHVSEMDKNTVYMLLSKFYTIIGNLDDESLDIIYLSCKLSENLTTIYYLKKGILEEFDVRDGEVQIVPKKNITLADLNNLIKELQFRTANIHEAIDKYISEADFNKATCVFHDEIIEMVKKIPWNKEKFETIERIEKILK